MQHIEDLKNKAQRWKDQLTKTPLERALSEATSNENWNPPTKVLQEIADATYSYTDCNTVMQYIWKRLNSDNKDWRRTLKTITVIEYLIKNGAPRCIGEFKEELFRIRTYSDFYLTDQGIDRGASIREKAKAVMDLLANEKLIEEERENAKKIKERLNGKTVGGAQGIGSDTSYQGFSSTSYTSNTSKTQQDNEYAKKYGVYPTGGEPAGKASVSGLDKYRTNKEPVAQAPVPVQPAQNPWPKVQEPTEIKKPFQEPVKRLAKPGEEWSVPQPQPAQWTVPQTQPSPVKAVAKPMDSLIDFEEAKPVQAIPAPNAPTDWGFPATQPQTQSTATQQPQFTAPQQFTPQQFTPPQPQFTAPQQPQFTTPQPQPQFTAPQPQPQFTSPQPQFTTTQPAFNTPQATPPQLGFQPQTNPQYSGLPTGPAQFYPTQPAPQPQQQIPVQFPPAYQPQQPQQFYTNQFQPQQQPYHQTTFTQQPQPGFQQPQPQGFTAPQYQQQQSYPAQQAKPQPSAQKNDDFQEFQSAGNPNQPKNAKQSLEDKFLDLSDLTKDAKAPPKQQTNTQVQQPSLYTSQSELDTFQLNYRQRIATQRRINQAQYQAQPQYPQYGTFAPNQQQFAPAPQYNANIVYK